MVTSYLRAAAAASMLSTSKLVDMPQLQTINIRIIAPLPSFQIVCLCCMDIVLTHYKHIREWPGLFLYAAQTHLSQDSSSSLCAQYRSNTQISPKLAARYSDGLKAQSCEQDR